MAHNQSDLAYSHLRAKIARRELPSGAKVRYGPLGKEIGMSATPIREAIGRLAIEGLVELVPQVGAIVKTPTREDALEVFEMREAIEPFAASKACELISVAQLRELEANIETMSRIARRKRLSRSGMDEFDQADLRFHLTILEAAANERMLKAVSDYHLLSSIIGTDRHSYSADILELTIEDHELIYTHLNQRSAAEVREAMLSHIRNSRQITLTLFKRL
ncbi:MAG: GntR family transcriptional regulator [Verrucomicrobiota bacterium]